MNLEKNHKRRVKSSYYKGILFDKIGSFFNCLRI